MLNVCDQGFFSKFYNMSSCCDMESKIVTFRFDRKFVGLELKVEKNCESEFFVKLSSVVVRSSVKR